MLRSALRATALVVLSLAAVWTVPSFAISKEFNQSYPLQPGGSLELQNVNGTVDVQGWDRNEIEVHAVKTAKHKESDLERVSIEVDAKPDAISIATRYPQNEGVEVAVEYTIHARNELILGGTATESLTSYAEQRRMKGFGKTRK
jgi:hypothetical protein